MSAFGTIGDFLRSLRGVLSLFLLAVLLPMLLLQAGIYYWWFQTQRSEELENSVEVARVVAAGFHEYVWDVARQEAALGNALVSLSPANAEQANAYLATGKSEYRAAVSFSWADPGGTVRYSSDPKAIGLSIRGRPYFRELERKAPWIVSDLLDEPLARGVMSFVIARRVLAPDGTVAGIMCAVVDPAELGHQAVSAAPPEDGRYSLFDRQGRIAFSRPENVPLGQNWAEHDPLLAESLAQRKVRSGITALPVDARPHLVARVPMKDFGWVVGAARPEAAAMAPIRRSVLLIAGLSALVVLASAAAAAFVSRQITTPLRDLREHTRAIGHGDFSHRAAPTAMAELHELSQALNQMAANLYARSLIEASLDPLVTISHEGRITDVNKASEQATGLARDRLVGTDFSEYFTEPEKAKEGYRKAIARGFVRDYPLTIRHVTGKTTDVLYNATVYRSESGRVLGVFAAARDVTERNATQRREKANSDLLELFVRKASRKEYLGSVVEVIREWSGCRCLGIRVVDDEGGIPYEAYAGFSREFWELENGLCLGKDRCVCVRTIGGSPEPSDVPCMTPRGSFRTENAAAFVAGLTQEQRSRYRGHCAVAGYKSLAVIPIRYRERVLGAIHMADEREGVTSAATVDFIETMAPLIGEAIHRFNAEEELRQHREHLEELVKQRTGELEEANRRLQGEIAERKVAAEALRETAEDLARSNKELEQFAYVASHDLQEPLRTVTAYLQLIERRYKGRLDRDADEFIGFAVDGSKRMQTLIQDLLTFSRIGMRARPTQPADSGTAVDKALDGLRSSIQETDAVVTRGPLPVVLCDPAQLAQLFQNLIANAIKFRAGRRPKIHVAAEREDGRWTFSVRDNGIGIEPQYFDRIFVIFQRLHGQQEYPGTGIGLAICKRIVERHGGRIWVESTPGEGSTFRFTLGGEGG